MPGQYAECVCAQATEQFKEQIREAGGGARNKENAYGQKEEGGISMRQMKQEMKRQMYLHSTEAAPEMGVIKKKNETQRYYPGGMAFPGGPRSKKPFWGLSGGAAGYKARPSRTQQLKNPRLRPKILTKVRTANSTCCVLDFVNAKLAVAQRTKFCPGNVLKKQKKPP